MPLVARSLRVDSQSLHALAMFASQVNHFPYVKKSGAYVALPSAEASARGKTLALERTSLIMRLARTASTSSSRCHGYGTNSCYEILWAFSPLGAQVLRGHRVPCVVLKAYRNSIDAS